MWKVLFGFTLKMPFYNINLLSNLHQMNKTLSKPLMRLNNAAERKVQDYSSHEPRHHLITYFELELNILVSMKNLWSSFLAVWLLLVYGMED
jgi:hypothetical protein